MVGKLNMLFFLYRSRVNQKQMMPVFCRVTLNGRRKQVSSGCFVKEIDWDSESSKHVGKTDEAKYVNGRLNTIRTRLLRSYNTLLRSHGTFSVDDLFDEYTGRTVKVSTVLGAFDHHIAQISELVGKTYSMATHDKFVLIKGHVADFINYNYRSQDMPLNELKLGFLQDLDHYLKARKAQSQNTVNKTIERIKKVIKIAVGHGWLGHDPFLLFLKKRFVKEVVFLDSEELTLLEQYQPTGKHVVVKDIFLFSCYTGLAYHEVSSLRASHLKKDKNGTLWIEMVRQKTKRPLCVLLLPKALDILRSYGYPANNGLLLPVLSNQKLNVYLKEFASDARINKHLTHHVARKTFASTLLLNNDIPVDVASFLLGHSKVSTTEEFYAKVQRDRVVSYMSKFYI